MNTTLPEHNDEILIGLREVVMELTQGNVKAAAAVEDLTRNYAENFALRALRRKSGRGGRIGRVSWLTPPDPVD